MNNFIGSLIHGFLVVSFVSLIIPIGELRWWGCIVVLSVLVNLNEILKEMK